MKRKTWKKDNQQNTWSVFKIMSEFVEGFEKLSNVGPCISIFGSARTKTDNPYYKDATTLAKKLTSKGFGIITGGGPGIMEAANKGANEQNGASVGLNIDNITDVVHREGFLAPLMGRFSSLSVGYDL